MIRLLLTLLFLAAIQLSTVVPADACGGSSSDCRSPGSSRGSSGAGG